jgi:hypothetical protein
LEDIWSSRDAQACHGEGYSQEKLNQPQGEQHRMFTEQLFNDGSALNQKNECKSDSREEGVDAEIVRLNWLPARSYNYSLK